MSELRDGEESFGNYMHELADRVARGEVDCSKVPYEDETIEKAAGSVPQGHEDKGFEKRCTDTQKYVAFHPHQIHIINHDVNSELEKALASALERVTAAAESTRKDPSHKQAEAGNYKMGHVNIHGLDITIETPAGASRAAKPGREKWPALKHHYGYIRSISDPDNPGKRIRTTGRDSDHVDVIIGPHPQSELVHVINQVNGHTDGSFDEHKCVLGCNNAAEAHKCYHDNYSQDWKGFGGLKQITMDQFKEWLAKGKRNRPI